MKKTNLLLMGVAICGFVASCGSKPSSNTLDKAGAEELIATFDKSLTGTAKVTYKADFELTVDSQNDMSSFERDVDDTTTFELDLTAGSVYMYGKTTGKSKAGDEVKTTEALVYNNGGTYYYLTSTMGSEKALASEAEALAKIDELMTSLSKENAGYIDTTSLLYTGINTYEHKEYLLGSTNILEADMDDPTSFEKTEEGGLVVTSEPVYVGYFTDAGTSELKNETEKNDFKVTTDAKGRVLGYELSYNDASLEMPIMTPAPILHLNGTRTLSASYGDTLTKKTTIDHEAVQGTIEIPESFTGGTVEVKTCAPMDFMNMKLVANGDKVDVGNWICIKPTPAGSNTVKSVMLGTQGTPLTAPEQAGGWYCFEVLEGNNKVSVIFEGSDIVEEVATIVINKGEHVTNVVAKYFAYPNVQDLKDLENGTCPIGPSIFVGFMVTVEDGYTASVKCEGVDVPVLGGGMNCLNVKEAKTYTIDVTAVAK